MRVYRWSRETAEEVLFVVKWELIFGLPLMLGFLAAGLPLWWVVATGFFALLVGVSVAILGNLDRIVKGG